MVEKAMKDSIGERFKQNYEEVWKLRLPMRLPTIIRLDGRCFHSFTKDMERPFDKLFIGDMAGLAYYLCENIQTAQFAYCQSDEISILLHPYKKLTSQAWFGGEIQKMVSISAGLASSWMSVEYEQEVVFDSRVFVLPESEVANYFLWRQMDWTRNSIQMLAQGLYSHKELLNKNTSELQELIFQKGVNWNDLETHLKRGLVVRKDDEGNRFVDWNPPIFSQDRNYIERYLEVEGE